MTNICDEPYCPKGRMGHERVTDCAECGGESRAVTVQNHSDEALRAVALKHARNAVAPVGSRRGGATDLITTQNIKRQEEIIFSAMKDALGSVPVEGGEIEPPDPLEVQRALDTAYAVLGRCCEDDYPGSETLYIAISRFARECPALKLKAESGGDHSHG